MTRRIKDEVIEAVAERVWISGSADQMIPQCESKQRWQGHKEAKTQRYLNTVHDVTDVLLALQHLGMLSTDCLEPE